jgi:hypothetical protein
MTELGPVQGLLIEAFEVPVSTRAKFPRDLGPHYASTGQSSIRRKMGVATEGLGPKLEDLLMQCRIEDRAAFAKKLCTVMDGFFRRNGFPPGEWIVKDEDVNCRTASGERTLYFFCICAATSQILTLRGNFDASELN